jgi:hypothetical protein
MHERGYIPHLQIRYKSAIAYTIPTERPNYARHEVRQHKTYTGGMTEHAKKRIRRAVEILVMCSPPQSVWNPVSQRPCNFRLTFATVTISTRTLIPHREAYERGLKPLLRVLRTRYDWKHYIWKAELQKRGQIHWHITGNRFLDYRYLKSEWNNIQYRNGWLQDYHERTGSWAPNSVDIHAVHNVARLDLYLAKYIAKSGATIQGKCWDTSASLAGKKFFATEIDSEMGHKLDAAQTSGKAQKIVLENCSIYRHDAPASLLSGTAAPGFTAWQLR